MRADADGTAISRLPIAEGDLLLEHVGRSQQQDRDMRWHSVRRHLREERLEASARLSRQRFGRRQPYGAQPIINHGAVWFL
jgi:hypothetical protein